MEEWSDRCRRRSRCTDRGEDDRDEVGTVTQRRRGMGWRAAATAALSGMLVFAGGSAAWAVPVRRTRPPAPATTASVDATIAGTITNAGGTPMAGACVQATDNSGDVRAQATADSAGVYSVPVAAGTYKVLFW